MRHGRPACDERTPLRRTEFAAWVAAYDRASLDPADPPPAGVRALAERAAVIVTSSLRRSYESAALVASARPAQRDALFDEAGIPAPPRIPLRLRPPIWDVVSRVAWLCGWSPDCESAAAARARAVRAAQRLEQLAAAHGVVMLLGHGMLNTFIAKSLRRSGWRGRPPRFAYWAAQAFRRTGPSPTGA